MTTPIRKFLGLCALGGTSYIAVRYRCDARDVQLYWSTVTRRDDAERNSTTPLPYSSFGMSPEHKRAVDWDEIAPTLQTGDLVFLRGTGSISTKICFISYLWSGLQPEALHFSHVAVVVRRPNPSTSIQVVEMTSKGRGKKWWEYIRLGKNLFTGTPQIVPVTESTCTRGELFLIEAIDNHDVCALDWDGVVRLNQVQVISPQHRIFGKQGSRECYSYCGVRRLRRKGTESHEDVECQRQAVDNFINTYAGRKLDTDPNLLLAHLHPRLYHRFPTMDSSITCSELVAQFYEAMGWTGRGAYESNLLPCEVSKQADPYSWAMDCVQQFREERQAPITATPWSLGFGTCETLFFHPDCAVAPEDFVIPVRIH